MANIPAGANVNELTLTEEKAVRIPKCARCRNHGFIVQLKGHSGKCQFKQCLCWKCSLINERTRILASQRRIRTEPPGAEHLDQTALSSRKTISAHNNKSTKGVKGETKKSNIKALADDTSCIELRAPVSTRGPVSADNCDLKSTAGTSPQNCAATDAPPFSGEYIVKEAVPGQMYPAEMFAMPLPLYQHYPDRYMFPAMLVTLRPPVPGTFREHVGFVPLPSGALSHPLDTPEWHGMIHVPHYSPYPTYPGLRDEPSQHSQSHMEGRSESPPQVTTIPESQVCGTQQTDAVPADGHFLRGTEMKPDEIFSSHVG